MARISQIEGLGKSQMSSLRDNGVRTTDDLLRMAADTNSRQQLARRARVSEEQLLEWTNRADLMRIRGIGREYSDLLEAAGVDTVRELANRVPNNLYRTLSEVNRQKHLTRRSPASTEVERWVTEAKRLPVMISH
jgi:predicted RecB family nuclease